MKTSFTHFLQGCFIFCLLQITFPQTATAQCSEVNEQDSLALAAIYEALNGEDWASELIPNWLNTDVSEWEGISLSKDGCRVKDLNIQWGVGLFPIEISSLTELTSLEITDSDIPDVIPSEIGNLTKLISLVITNSNISGAIPSEIGNLTGLRNLDLSRNNLTDNIPSEIGNLTGLRNLDLSQNNLIGNIPPEIGELTELRNLVLYSNNLTGSTPPEIGSLSLLTNLFLSGNSLTGSIPAEIGNLNALTILGLGNNQFTGTIPAEIGNLCNLIALSFSGNNLSGSIPPEIGNLTKLQELFLNDNQFTGQIPATISNLSDVFELYLSNNNLSGPLPPEMGQLNQIFRIHLKNNALTGSIPASFVDMTHLDKMYLQNNQLSGCLPDTLQVMCSEVVRFILDGNPDLDTQDWNSFCCHNQGACTLPLDNYTGMRFLDSIALVKIYYALDGENWSFAENWLTGTVKTWAGVSAINGGCRVGRLQIHYPPTGNIPSEIALLTKLTHFAITGPYIDTIPSEIWQLNNLREFILYQTSSLDTIPPEIAQLRNLVKLQLTNSIISGPIPPEIGQLQHLELLILDNIQLSDSIPPEIGNLSNLQYLSLQDNQLSGSIPPEIGQLTKVTDCYLKGNQLYGDLPSEIGNMSALKYFQVSDNYISGTIPSELSSLSQLLWLQLNNNNFSGCIPEALQRLCGYFNMNLDDNPNLDTEDWSAFCCNYEGACNAPLSTSSGINTYESLALVALYNNTNGNNWLNNDNWLTSPISDWYGVEDNDCRITGLDLSYNNLSGTLPEEMGALLQLNYLNLNNNNLNGDLPDTLRMYCDQFDFTSDITANPNLTPQSWATFCEGSNPCGPLVGINEPSSSIPATSLTLQVGTVSEAGGNSYYLTFNQALKTLPQLHLFNIMGQPMGSINPSQVNFNSPTSTLYLDNPLSIFPKGMYLLMVTYEGEMVGTKLIK